jgi:gas vesicle protein
MSDNNDFAAFFVGMIVGGLVGAATALLLAPQSGEETRTMIRDKGIELKDKAVEVGQDVQLRAEKALEDTREQLEVVLDDLKDRTDELGKILNREKQEADKLAKDAKPAVSETKPAA